MTSRWRCLWGRTGDARSTDTYNCAMSTRKESRNVNGESAQGRRPEGERSRGAKASAARSWSAGGRGARLLAEAGWIAGTLIALALAVALVSYQREDPGFSNSVSVPHVQNLAGRVGAWLADSMLVAFGYSAYLWVLAALAWSARFWRRLFVHRRAAAAEGHRDGVAPWLRALALLALSALAASLHFGFSWLGLAEAIGSAFEAVSGRVRRMREAKIDRSIGEAAVAEREATLAHERERLVEAPPVHIERQSAHPPPSERRQKERQVPPVSGLSPSTVPPPGLLDEPAPA